MARVVLLSYLSQLCETRELHVEAPTVKALLGALDQRFGPEFTRARRRCRVVVNGRAVLALKRGRTPLGPDDEVTLLPPAGGG